MARSRANWTCRRSASGLSAVEKSNYVDGYTLELAAKGSAVTWGEVAWEEDPFEDLTCDSVMVAAADHVDVCDLFMDEVEAALEDGWAGSKGNTVNFSALSTRADWLEMFTFSAPASAESRRFATLWFNTTEGGQGHDRHVRRCRRQHSRCC